MIAFEHANEHFTLSVLAYIRKNYVYEIIFPLPIKVAQDCVQLVSILFAQKRAGLL